MAGRADAIRTAVVGIEPCVVEYRSTPRRCGVASRARRREPSRGMVRIRCPHVLSPMARVAVRRRSNKNVVHMAQRTLHRHMRPGQRERRLRVIKHRPGPTDCRMTRRARCRKSCRNVIRIRSPRILRLVAGIAVGRHRREIIRHMAQ